MSKPAANVSPGAAAGSYMSSGEFIDTNNGRAGTPGDAGR
jgi:hypothetical protein